MAQRFAEVFTRLANEVHHTLTSYLTAEREGVDKHAHRVSYAHVAAAVADGGQTKAVTVGKARERVENARKNEMCGGDAIGGSLTAEGVDGLEIQRRSDFADGALITRIREVRQQLRHALHAVQALGKEGLGRCVIIATDSLLLGADVIGKTQILHIDGIAVKGAAQLAIEEVVGTSVRHKVMEVGKQILVLLRLDDLDSVHRALLQIEGLYESILVG